jgi:hypothetical protein
MPEFYLYTDIPGSGKGWTLAVYAISRKDADTYIKALHHHGKFLGKHIGGEVKANCGATTEEAHLRIKEQNDAII